jgi:hypothetical protein
MKRPSGAKPATRAIDDLLARHDWRKPMSSRFYPEFDIAARTV